MIKIQGKKVSIDREIQLNPKQLMRFRSLKEKERLDYFLSLMGIEARSLCFDSLSKGKYDSDSLSEGKNKYLRKLNQLLDNSHNANHKPSTRKAGSQWVGVEIECYIGDSDCDEDECEYCHGEGTETCHNCEGSGTMTFEDDCGYTYETNCARCDGDGYIECSECEGHSSGGRSNNFMGDLRDAFKKAKITHCSVRSDGSLNDGGGVEVCLLFDASKGYEKLKKVCGILEDFGASINTDCGLHVHLDYTGRTRDTILKIGKHFEKFLPVLAEMQPNSRRHNTYCRMQSSITERYSAINLTAFNKHKTIECRLHSGTTNFEKIKNWVELLICIKKRYNPRKPFKKIKTFQRFIDVLELPDNLVGYYDRRLQKFNPDYMEVA